MWQWPHVEDARSSLVARSPCFCINPCADPSGSPADSFAAAACRRLSYIVKRFIVVGSWRQFVAPRPPSRDFSNHVQLQLPFHFSLRLQLLTVIQGVCVPAARRRSLDDNCYAYRMLCEYEFGQRCCQMGERGWGPGQIAVDCQARTVGDPRCQVP